MIQCPLCASDVYVKLSAASDYLNLFCANSTRESVKQCGFRMIVALDAVAQILISKYYPKEL